MAKFICTLLFLLSGCVHSNKTITYEFYQSTNGLKFGEIIKFSDEVNYQDLKFKRNEESEVNIKKQKEVVSIGIVEYGFVNPKSNGKKIINKRFGKKLFSQSEMLKFNDHAEYVAKSFLENESFDEIKIYNCALSDQLNLEECLEWLKDNNVLGINISIGIDYATKKTYNIINELLNNNVIITVAAGNDGVMKTGICREFLKIVCVGLLENDGKVSSISNYGPYVSAWDLGFEQKIIGKYKTEEPTSCSDCEVFNIITNGTSFSAPKYLAKKIKKYLIN